VDIKDNILNKILSIIQGAMATHLGKTTAIKGIPEKMPENAISCGACPESLRGFWIELQKLDVERKEIYTRGSDLASQLMDEISENCSTKSDLEDQLTETRSQLRKVMRKTSLIQGIIVTSIEEEVEIPLEGTLLGITSNWELFYLQKPQGNEAFEALLRALSGGNIRTINMTM